MGIEAGGLENLGFIKDDMKRHLQTRRQRSMKYEEAAVLLDYFQEHRAQNSTFYLAYFLDDEQQITNIFWSDIKIILDYANFGDVVTFDTTYKTNDSYRLCAVFANFSNNRKTTIFGATLMYDETAPSFEWVFRQFKHCMSQKEPKTIFTDQSQAIAIGLEKVMPNVKYCLRTWHLTMNLRKHHGCLLKKKNDLVGGWHDCMDSCMSEETFDEVWNSFLEKHGQVKMNDSSKLIN